MVGVKVKVGSKGLAPKSWNWPWCVRSAWALVLGGALCPTVSWAGVDCQNGTYCPTGTTCSPNGLGCFPEGSDGCDDGVAYCPAGTFCCADDTCVTDATDCDRPNTPGPNSCQYAYDHECDEGIYCLAGTDTSDCAALGYLDPYAQDDGDDSCVSALNGRCEEGVRCDVGTDSSDCSGLTTTTDGQEVTCSRQVLTDQDRQCTVDYCIVTSSTDYCVKSYYLTSRQTFPCPDGCADRTVCVAATLDACGGTAAPTSKSDDGAAGAAPGPAGHSEDPALCSYEARPNRSPGAGGSSLGVGLFALALFALGARRRHQEPARGR